MVARAAWSPPHLVDGGLWGERGVTTGARAAPSHTGRRSDAWRREADCKGHSLRRLCDRRDTKRSDWRGGRAAAGMPRRSAVGLQAARQRAWRVTGGTIWREHRASSSSGTVDHAQRDGHRGPRSPATGRAAVVMNAGAAGHIELREGWKPVRVEMPAAGPRPDPQRTSLVPERGDTPCGQHRH
jgi:hypothetical protein